jgi:hypothetical protein
VEANSTRGQGSCRAVAPSDDDDDDDVWYIQPFVQHVLSVLCLEIK